MEAKGEMTLFERAVREAATGVIALEEACKFRDFATELSGRKPALRSR
jgi:hypothetical protein